MSRQLLKIEPEKGLKLSKQDTPFRIAISQKIDNGFELKDMDKETVRGFHRFVSETVYKNQTISDVENRYLRTKDSNLDEKDAHNVIHLGHDGSTFRLFGYYDFDGYFVITRIDGKHKTHKS